MTNVHPHSPSPWSFVTIVWNGSPSQSCLPMFWGSNIVADCVLSSSINMLRNQWYSQLSPHPTAYMGSTQLHPMPRGTPKHLCISTPWILVGVIRVTPKLSIIKGKNQPSQPLDQMQGNDTPPNSLKDFNASLKWKQWKKELGYALTRSTSKVRGVC
jgi:hypothetical protein